MYKLKTHQKIPPPESFRQHQGEHLFKNNNYHLPTTTYIIHEYKLKVESGTDKHILF